jgi:hypothetical protein
MPNTWSIFAIGRQRGKEDQLTEMLAWLIDAVPDVGRAIVDLAFDVPAGDGAIQVGTQAGIAAGRLDAVLTGPSFALVVESKLDSDFHDDQIKRYLDWLETTHEHRERRGLLTLTKHPLSERQRAELTGRCPGVVGSAHLWEELHAQLGSLLDSSDQDSLSAKLIEEFLSMLSEEGLIPVKPITADELTTWRDAAATVERFHDFFNKCKEAIAAALGAKPISNSAAARHAYAYQDYLLDDGTRIVVGIDASDDGRVPKSVARRSLVLWMAVEAKHRDDWAVVADRMDSAPPEGWSSRGHRWWGERPHVWRYLDEVLGVGSFEDQRARLGEACAAAVGWLRSAEQSAGEHAPMDGLGEAPA